MIDELTDCELVQLCRDMPLLKPRRIVLTGGEPLLRPETLELARIIKRVDSKIYLAIATNGKLVIQDNVGDLVQAFDEVRISIDGSRDLNDLFRGEGSYETATRALRCVLNAGGNPTASITATSANLGQLEDFLKSLLENGICRFHITPMKLAGRANDASLLCNSDELRHIVNNFWCERFGFRMSRGEGESFNCGAGRYLSIHPDGSVYPCHILAFPEFCIGNIRTHTLKSIFYDSVVMKTLRRLRQNEIGECMSRLLGLSSQISCWDVPIQNEMVRSELKKTLQSDAD
jgi:MoaA/NifB/PqqE/SkfB family radical SAM enzyme